MSRRPNAAVEWLRSGRDILNSLEQPPTGVLVTDDFVFQDTRSGFNFGRIEGAAAYLGRFAYTGRATTSGLASRYSRSPGFANAGARQS